MKDIYKETFEFLGFEMTKNVMQQILKSPFEIERTKKGEHIDAILEVEILKMKFKIGIEIKMLTKDIYIKEKKVTQSLECKDKYNLDAVLFFAFVGLHDLYVYRMSDIEKGECGECVYKTQLIDYENPENGSYNKPTFKLDKDKALHHYTF